MLNNLTVSKLNICTKSSGLTRSGSVLINTYKDFEWWKKLKFSTRINNEPGCSIVDAFNNAYTQTKQKCICKWKILLIN